MYATCYNPCPCYELSLYLNQGSWLGRRVLHRRVLVVMFSFFLSDVLKASIDKLVFQSLYMRVGGGG